MSFSGNGILGKCLKTYNCQIAYLTQLYDNGA